jgi:uncharacterized membrane protein YdfJ with MMPL/SSD domain
MLDALARLATRHSRLVLVAAAIVFVVAGVLGAGVAKRLDPFGAEDPATESVIADHRLQAAGFREPTLVVLISGVDVRASSDRKRVEAITRMVERDRDVASVTSFLTTHSRDFLSRDGRSTYLAVALRPTSDHARQDAAGRVAGSLAGARGVSVGGTALAERQVNKQVERDLRTAELYAFPLVFLLSLLFFRSLVAALLPLLVGGLAILGTLLLLRVTRELTSVSIFALNVATGLGLGLGIDYSLFLVSRYREELGRAGPGFEAMRRTLTTAGRTVLFSALTVAGALASLLVFPQRFLYSMGISGVFVALLAAGIALIVLPAVLAVLGRRVNALAPRFLARRAEREARPSQQGFWYRLARLVMRRPAPIAAAAAALLIALGLPFLGVKYTAADARILPSSASARQVDDTLRAQFPPYRDTPITLAIEGDARQAARVAHAAAKQPGAAAVRPPVRVSARLYAVQAFSAAAPYAGPSQRLIHRLRLLPGDVLVTGATAHYVDMQHSLAWHLPLALAIVAALTIVALFAMTGSLILPLKQLLMNTLTISAMLGILVLIFQDGRLQGLLGYSSQGALEAPQLLLLFAVIFGLSTDYGVFLLARIKEARDDGASDPDAISAGLERTGRLVTAAALLFSIVFFAFLTSKIIITKELGLGTALAVLIDASIVRALLVPSLMRLLGRWNWWAPAPLQRLHARIGGSDASTEPQGRTREGRRNLPTDVPLSGRRRR